MLWENLTPRQFPEAVKRSKGVCLIPIGCVETHGNHIVLGCDTLDIGALCRDAAERENCVVFPKMYFGEKNGAGEYPGTLIFPNRLIHRILWETCCEIARNGFDKIIIVNGHGGNKAMLDHVCNQFLQERPDFMVFRARTGLGDIRYITQHFEEYPWLTEEDKTILQDYVDKGKKDGHGGFAETGMAYGNDPKYVNLENFGTLSGTSTGLFDGFSQRGIYTPFGWMGNQPNSLHCDLHDGMNQRIAKAIYCQTANKLSNTVHLIKEDTTLRAAYDGFCDKPTCHGKEEA